MTSKQAIDFVREYPYLIRQAMTQTKRNSLMNKNSKALDILEKLVERDTPKATIKKIKVIYTQHKCPICACRLEMIPLEEVNFCPKCGQRLDWK